MKPLTRQDHIDPLIQEVHACNSSSCGPRTTMAIFTRPRGPIVDFEPVWVCSSGHCSDYDDIPNLRRPELDPVEWIKAHPLRLMESLPVEKCVEHEEPMTHDARFWGMDGHLWRSGLSQELKLCLPLVFDE